MQDNETYKEIYKRLDGLTALCVAEATSLKRQKDERDTAFVKRIVATYIMLAAATAVSKSWFCYSCKVEVRDLRCQHCGKTVKEMR